jgi:hypothetical protein
MHQQLLSLRVTPGLGELACHAAQLDNWHATTKHHHNAHLQQHTVRVPATAAQQMEDTRACRSADEILGWQLLQLLLTDILTTAMANAQLGAHLSNTAPCVPDASPDSLLHACTAR